MPRLADGRPDLEGVWDFRTLTPLQRSEELGEKAVLSEEEAAEIEARAAQAAVNADQPSDVDREAPPKGANVGGYNNFWFDRGAGVSEDRRSSLIVDPPNGRIPAAQPDVPRQTPNDDAESDLPVRLRVGGIGTGNPEDRGLAERCLLGFNSGPPIIPGGYNQNVRIVQTPDNVVILNEMVHHARIVPVDGARLPRHIRPWMGSSIARWDGDVLIVETTNFRSDVSSFAPSVFASVGSAEHMRVTERFERLDEDTLRYEWTVDDPATYTRPFTAVMLMKKSTERLYEYACHEGNYAMGNILRGARLLEAEAASGATGGGAR